jgi:hypothetical protein
MIFTSGLPSDQRYCLSLVCNSCQREKTCDSSARLTWCCCKTEWRHSYSKYLILMSSSWHCIMSFSVFTILQLRGLEKHLKIASQKKDFNIGEKWHDLNVTKWPVIEQFPEPMQTDGYAEKPLKLYLSVSRCIQMFVSIFEQLHKSMHTDC